MTNQELVLDQTDCKRKEPRFKAEEERLQCETTIAQCGLLRGCVIDLSRSGIRVLCEGTFEVGQAIFTELTTDRSHGIYRGVIRRVEPWVGGQCVLGCSLDEQIPENVLQDLADEGAVNRRNDDRIELNQRAKVSWPLSREEVDVELKDFSTGGMKIVATEPIPDDVRLRFRIEQDGDELVIEAKSVWKKQSDDGCVAGVTFTHGDAPARVASVLRLANTPAEESEPTEQPPYDRRALAIRAGFAAAGLAAVCLVASILV